MYVYELWCVFVWLDVDDYVEEEVGVEGEVWWMMSLRIWLSYSAVVSGECFREIYYWDTYWIVLGLLMSEMLVMVLGVMNNLLYMVIMYGFVFNGVCVYYLNWF